MKKYRVKLNPIEIKIIIESLNLMRNNLIKESSHTDPVDELLVKHIKKLKK